jgi:hypothetical protein
MATTPARPPGAATQVTMAALETLAARCVNGAPDAGIELVRRLWSLKVPDDDKLIVGLVALASPETLHLTSVQFDRLADALAAARVIRDQETTP